MSRREARQIAYSIAGSLCQAEADGSSHLTMEVLAANGYDETDHEKVTTELADIARRLAFNGRRVKA